MLKLNWKIAVLFVLLSSSLVTNVWANGYEAERVGGILSPANGVMTLTQAVLLGIAIAGIVCVFGAARIKKT